MNKSITIVSGVSSLLTILAFLFGDFSFQSIINMDFIKEYLFYISLTVTVILWIITITKMLRDKVRKLEVRIDEYDRNFEDLKAHINNRIEELEAKFNRRYDDYSNLIDSRFKQIYKE